LRMSMKTHFHSLMLCTLIIPLEALGKDVNSDSEMM